VGESQAVRRKILFVSTWFPSPGFETRGTFNLEMVKAWARQHDVLAVTPIPWVDALRRGLSANEASHNHFATANPTFYYTPKIFRTMYHRFMEWSFRPLQDRIEQFDPEVVFGYWAHPDGAVAMQIAHRRNAQGWIIIGGSDVLLLARNPRRRRAILNAIAAADGVVCVSENLRRRLIEFGVDQAKLFVVRRGVDRARFRPGDRQAAMSALGLTSERPMLLWVGRMVPVKGLEDLLAAAARVKASGTDFQLCLIGDGPLRKRLTSQASALGLDDCVRFVGKVAHAALPDWFRAAELVLMSSHSEGVPNVLLEAHACGTRFVATDVGGIPDILVPGADLIAPAQRPDLLAKAILDSLRLPPVDAAELANGVASVETAAARILDLAVRGRSRVFDAGPTEKAIAH